MINNSQIAKNTIFLYFRMILLMVVNLYTSRVVLKSLGVVDYGIYNAVGGFISMFSMVSSALSTAISRYITYSLGEGNEEKLSRIFSTSILVQCLLVTALFVLSETVGIWFLNSKMTIPVNRIFAANIVFQCTLLTFSINLLSVPYNAALIAHENMKAFAVIGLLEGLISLLTALLVQVSQTDKLITYAALMMGVALLIRVLYGYYCKRHYVECHFRFIFERSLVKDMLGFAGWNFIGVTAGVLRSQGLTLLFNVYIGPSLNAARGLAMQVFQAVNKFSGSFYTAVQPQITKSFAANQINDANKIASRSSKLAFFLLLLIILPILWETEYILHLWLEEVPQHTVWLTKIVLLFSLSEAYSQPLIYLMLATGNIKRYQIIVGGLCLLNFPLAWFLLYLKQSPELVQGTTILFSLILLFVRLKMLNSMTQFPVNDFMKRTLGISILISLLSCICPFILCTIFEQGWQRLMMNVFLSDAVTMFVIYTLGLSSGERIFFWSKVKQAFYKLKKYN